MEEFSTQTTMDDFTTSLANEFHKFARTKRKKSRTSHKIISEKSEDVNKGDELLSMEGDGTQVASVEFTETKFVNEDKKVTRKKKKSLASNAKNKADKSVGEVNINKSTEDDHPKVNQNKIFQSGVEKMAKATDEELVDEIQDVDTDCSKGMKSLIERTSKRKKKHHCSRISETDDANDGDNLLVMEEFSTQTTMNDFTTSSANEFHKFARTKTKKSRTSHKIISEKSEHVNKDDELLSMEGDGTQVASVEFTETKFVNEDKKVSRKKKKSLASNAKNKADKSVGEVNINKSTEDDHPKVKQNKIFPSGVEKMAKATDDELVDEIQDVDTDCSKGMKTETKFVNEDKKVSRKKKKSLAPNAKNKADKSVEVNINKSTEDDHPKVKQNKIFQSGVEKMAKATDDELVDEIQDVDTDSSRGMKKWLNQYWSRRPGFKILQDNIDQFLVAHEAAEEKARKEREALAAEGGWTVVVHHKGRKKTTDAETGVTVSSVAQAAVMDNLAKKKKKDIPLDFYRFQKREARRNEVMQLQSKFEQEKKRIQQLRAARKFRPF